MDKESIYKEIASAVEKMAAEGEAALLQKTSELLQEGLGFWWTGFYIVEECAAGWAPLDIGTAPDSVKEEESEGLPALKGPWMRLGPSVGPPACERIRHGRGVCGTAWAEDRTVIVPDVDAFPGHIACSSESRSEIVVPVHIDGKVAGVLDVDSRDLATFDDRDAFWLEKIAATVSGRR